MQGIHDDFETIRGLNYSKYLSIAIDTFYVSFFVAYFCYLRLAQKLEPFTSTNASVVNALSKSISLKALAKLSIE